MKIFGLVKKYFIHMIKPGRYRISQCIITINTGRHSANVIYECIPNIKLSVFLLRCHQNLSSMVQLIKQMLLIIFWRQIGDPENEVHCQVSTELVCVIRCLLNYRKRHLICYISYFINKSNILVAIFRCHF